MYHAPAWYDNLCEYNFYLYIGAMAISFAEFGPGTDPIVLDDVNCGGDEDRLIDCSNSGLGVHNCIHAEDASVRCVLDRMFPLSTPPPPVCKYQ